MITLSYTTTFMNPLSAIAAASHPNPYPYYRRLLEGPALLFDPALGLWVASRNEVIEEVLANPHCVVRPTSEPVPKVLAGSSAGAVFARLVRMNEGCLHADGRRAISNALAAVDMSALRTRSEQLAGLLGKRHGLLQGVAITRWIFDLPTYVIADLLGFTETQLPQVARWTADFVRCLSPLSTPDQLTSATRAANALQDCMARVLKVDGLARRASQANWIDQDALIANMIGLLSQTHEATAGLIGNCIVALLAQPGMEQRLRDDPQLTVAFVQEVARYDPPVQNTRRFVAQQTSVAGVSLQPGDMILLLLAAAGRGEQCNAEAGLFSLDRKEGKLTGFGHGRHACPGQQLAFTIATSAVLHLMTVPLPLSAASLDWRYAPSVNGRLPQFFTK